MLLKIQTPSENITIVPWTIRKEKEYLLALDESMNIQDKVNLAYEKLIGKSHLHYQEKLHVLMDAKSKIVTDRIEITYTCEGCGQLTEASIHTGNALEMIPIERKTLNFDSCSIMMAYGETLIDSVEYLNDIDTMQTITNKSIISEYLESLDIAEYDYLLFMYETLSKPFSFNGKGNCLICGHVVEYSPTDEELINTVTSVTIKDYYVLMADLKTHGFSVEEYNDFMPFELEMIMGILRQRKGASNG